MSSLMFWVGRIEMGFWFLAFGLIAYIELDGVYAFEQGEIGNYLGLAPSQRNRPGFIDLSSFIRFIKTSFWRRI